MIRNLLVARAALLHSIMAALVVVGALAASSPAQDSAAQLTPEQQQALALQQRQAAEREAAVAQYRTSLAAFNAALDSRDPAQIGRARADLEAKLAVVQQKRAGDVVKEEAAAAKTRYDAFVAANRARVKLDGDLKTAEADASKALWASVESQLMSIAASRAAAGPAMTEASAADVDRRAQRLQDGVKQFKDEQAAQVREAKTLAEVVRKLDSARRLVGRNNKGDLDRADAAVGESDAALKGITRVPTTDAARAIADLREDIALARKQLAVAESEAALVRDVSAFAREAQASKPDEQSLGLVRDRATAITRRIDASPLAAERKADLAADVKAQVDSLQSRVQSAADLRAKSDFDAAAVDVQALVESAAAAILAGRLEDASSSLAAARPKFDALRGMPAASSYGAARISGLESALQRLDSGLKQAQADAGVDAAVKAAEEHLDRMETGSWQSDIDSLRRLAEGSGIGKAAASRATRTIAQLQSSLSKYQALIKQFQPADDLLKSDSPGRALSLVFNLSATDDAQRCVDQLRSDYKSPPLLKDDLEWVNRLASSIQSRIDAVSFWRKMVVLGTVLVLALAVAAALLWRRGARGGKPETGAGGGAVDDVELDSPWPASFESSFRGFESSLARKNLELSLLSNTDLAARGRLAASTRVAAEPIVAVVDKASEPTAQFSRLVRLARQLIAVGEASQARQLLQAADDEGVLPPQATPQSSPQARRDRLQEWLRKQRGAKAQLARVPILADALIAKFQSNDELGKTMGDRALQVARVWREVWEAEGRRLDSQSSDAAKVEGWLSTAEGWLDDAADVPVLIEKARFQGEQAHALQASGAPFEQKLDEAAKSAKDAIVRFEQRGAHVAVPLKCEAYLLAINLDLDRGGVVALLPGANGEAPAWRPGSRSAAPQTLAADQARRIASLRGLLASMPEPGRTLWKFRADVADVRMQWGTGSAAAAEDAVKRLLAESADEWSEDQGAAFQLPPAAGEEDRLVLRELRLNWIAQNLSLGRASGNSDDVGRAAALVVRYWRQVDRLAGPPDSVALGMLARLRRAGSSILDMGPGATVPGAAAWRPNPNVPRQLAVWSDLVRRLTDGGQDGASVSVAVPQGFDPHSLRLAVVQSATESLGAQRAQYVDVAVVQGPSGAALEVRALSGTDRDAVVAIIQSRTKPQAPMNLWLRKGRREQVVNGLPGVAPGTVVVNELSVIDPTGSEDERWTGWMAKVRVSEAFVARVGHFGHDLLEVYSARMEPSAVDADGLFESGGNLIGSATQLGKLTFDGVRAITQPFEVVLFDKSGSERKSIRVAGIAARPAPERRPAETQVEPELIESWLFEIGLVIVGVSSGAKRVQGAMPASSAFTGDYRLADLVLTHANDAWFRLAHEFYVQLGTAQPQVLQHLQAHVQQAAQGSGASSVRAADATVLDLQLLARLVQSMNCRPAAFRLAEAKEAWKRMSAGAPALHRALARMLRAYIRDNTVFDAAVVQEFGLHVDPVQGPSGGPLGFGGFGGFPAFPPQGPFGGPGQFPGQALGAPQPAWGNQMAPAAGWAQDPLISEYAALTGDISMTSLAPDSMRYMLGVLSSVLTGGQRAPSVLQRVQVLIQQLNARMQGGG